MYIYIYTSHTQLHTGCTYYLPIYRVIIYPLYTHYTHHTPKIFPFYTHDSHFFPAAGPPQGRGGGLAACAGGSQCPGGGAFRGAPRAEVWGPVEMAAQGSKV